ncbi:F-box only protein 9-like [Gigantopelta aegis]|uniref:F-box only protein 9-like n=1 Tax=Gigantopelta aegis TaxID=1735272 RepID=UPI001B88A433|nr:F-box only protein 9-like [Gigantopelta aegis]
MDSDDIFPPVAKDDREDEEEEEERDKEQGAEPVVEEGEEYLEEQLEHFRKEWKNELEKDMFGNNQLKTGNDFSIEQQATDLFMQGIEAEKEGALYEAIAFYRKSVQLVPDIESKIDFLTHRSPRERQDSETSLDGSQTKDELEDDLLTHFQNLHINENAICEMAVYQRMHHISILPIEVILYIFKWVVSADLDIQALETLSEVCRGFYLCARDERIWKLSCQKIWGENVSGVKKFAGSWRRMFIEKPHVLLNGCYISRTTYVRQGEQSLDYFYRPYHVVEYYRFVRFFPEGSILMLCSPEDPGALVAKLRSPNSKSSGLLKGFYKITGRKVTAVLKREKHVENNQMGYRYRRQRPNQNDQAEQLFSVEFDLRDAGKRAHAQLTWQKYSISTICTTSGQETIADFDINKKSFPPLNFSRVRSYTSFSTKPLGD